MGFGSCHHAGIPFVAGDAFFLLRAFFLSIRVSKDGDRDRSIMSAAHIVNEPTKTKSKRFFIFDKSKSLKLQRSVAVESVRAFPGWVSAVGID